LGFLEGYDLLLNSKNNDRDYHKTMDGNLFVFPNRVFNQLIHALTKLDRKFVVIFDNAPYHSVQLDKPPTFSSKKSQMQEWLINHDVENFSKKQLWDLIKPFKIISNRRGIETTAVSL
jgi:hypothetical protein